MSVVKMPDLLERRAVRIEAGLEQRIRGHKEWIEGTLIVSVELAGARREMNDVDFGRWCDSRFGDNRLPKDERAIYVKFGENQDWTRTVLEKTERTSIQMIHRNEWEVRSATNHQTNSVEHSKAEKFDAARNYAQATEALAGKLPSDREIAEAIGGTKSTANEVLQVIRRNRPEDFGRVQFTKATQAHIEAAITHRKRELEKEFNERVRLAMLERNKDYLKDLNELQQKATEQQEMYERLNNDFKPLFNETEFMTILTCLHPDNSASIEKRNTAFRAFNAVKFQLTGKK